MIKIPPILNSIIKPKNRNTFTTTILRRYKILRHPYLSESVEAAEQFIEDGDQFLCRALRGHLGEAHDVSEQDAGMMKKRIDKSKQYTEQAKKYMYCNTKQ